MLSIKILFTIDSLEKIIVIIIIIMIIIKIKL